MNQFEVGPNGTKISERPISHDMREIQEVNHRARVIRAETYINAAMLVAIGGGLLILGYAFLGM